LLNVRISDELEKKLNKLSEKNKVSKSSIVKEALETYFAEIEAKENKSPYDLGEDLFGRNGSGKGNLSTTYKTKIKEKIHEKNSN
jgi:predicted DNA-binding protein